ncbi:MAG: amidase [Gemmatimonadaceae bacterium]
MNTRRDFLIKAPVGLLGLAAACRGDSQPGTAASAGTPSTPGAPVAFGTTPLAGPEVTPNTFAEAAKLMQVSHSEAEREMMAASWRRTLATQMERRTGAHPVPMPATLSPASVWNPVQAVGATVPSGDGFVRAAGDLGPLPTTDDAIAFAPVTQLSRWIERRQLTSVRLTQIYLARIAKYDPTLRCVITLTADRALARAKAMDAEIAAGRYRGPLHGIPYGVKDLLDTAGIPTTYGAEPFKNRVPIADAPVVQRLDAAGAVLLAKLSLGALALNDIWFGGQTMNPWLPEEGASGSSAGPGAATAAGLVGFSIGSETGGSIVSPSMRCGVTGLRPTFGRVPRTGAMTLCWSLDKLGPMTRGVEDAMLVLRAISGPDAGDVSSVPSRLAYAGDAPVRGLRVGYFPAWMEAAPATPVDRRALEQLTGLGLVPVQLAWPDLPHSALMNILFSEAAASFEELTLSGQAATMKSQVPDAWPNLFRMTRFLSSVDFVQADRLRRRFAELLHGMFAQADVLLVPSLRDEMLTVTNFTGQPSLTVRTGFVEVTEARSDWAPDPAHPLPRFAPARRVPHGVTLIGRHFDEGTIVRVGCALERVAHVSQERPTGF